VPDLRGLFLRGYGSQVYAQDNGTTVGLTSTLHASGQLGQVQGDASRPITGRFHSDGLPGRNLGAFYPLATSVSRGLGVVNGEYGTMFDSSRVVPTAPENRPVNQAVRYLVRARP